MKPQEFIGQIDQEKVVAAIREAEEKMCGEIRVFISRKEPDDAVTAAQRRFLKLGMEKTKERNGVLIYVAPRVKKFAIIGDTAVHAKCSDTFWREVAAEMAGHFRAGDFTNALIHGIRRAGKLLAEHFPRRAGDKNQLPNDIAHD